MPSRISCSPPPAKPPSITTDKDALAGLNDAQIAAAAQAAKGRDQQGYLIPLQNTTQQPSLVSLSDRDTRHTLFENSWLRAVRGGDNDTRSTITRMAQLRAEKAKLLGFPTYAAWKLENQMAKTPEAAQKFLDDLVPAATANALAEGKDIQAIIDAKNGDAQKGRLRAPAMGLELLRRSGSQGQV